MIDWTKLHPHFAQHLTELVETLKVSDLKMVGTSGYRSPEEQERLYAQGRTKPGKVVTNARGGQSPHNWGCACDFAFVKDGEVTWNGEWSRFGALVRQTAGLTWGGGFHGFADRPHVELTSWRAVKQANWHPKEA